MIVLPRLYAILDIDLAHARGLVPVELMDTWLDAGIRLIQLRAKHLTGGPMLELADALQERCRLADATFIVNDRADIARLSGAAGVHVGQTDLRPADARKVVGVSAIVGVSTHRDTQMRAALDEPVNYVAVGPVFQTNSKVKPDPVIGLEGVRRLAALAPKTPVVAIGGITVERAMSVIEAGATTVAVISDLLHADPGLRARQYLDALR